MVNYSNKEIHFNLIGTIGDILTANLSIPDSIGHAHKPRNHEKEFRMSRIGIPNIEKYQKECEIDRCTQKNNG